jgi:oligopeptide transport system permease protein
MTLEIVKFLLKRFVVCIFAIFVIASATFFLMKAIPGSPFADDQILLPETLAALNNYYGLNDPLGVQYIRYLKSIFSFELGPSLKYTAQTVNEIILGAFPISACIGLEALILSLPLGMLVGTLLALYSTGWKNVFAASITVLGVSVPSFVIATSLQFLFALYFPIFPVAQWGSFAHTVLPAFSLAVAPTCFIARLLRSNILEVLNKQYIQTARMKGLSEARIMTVHVWKNAIIPVLAYLGPVITNILVGSFVVERVFGIPGLGQWFVNGVINRDYPVIGGLTLFYSVFLLINHTIIDLLTAFLNPEAKIISQTPKTVGKAS